MNFEVEVEVEVEVKVFSWSVGAGLLVSSAAGACGDRYVRRTTKPKGSFQDK